MAAGNNVNYYYKNITKTCSLNREQKKAVKAALKMGIPPGEVTSVARNNLSQVQMNFIYGLMDPDRDLYDLINTGNKQPGHDETRCVHLTSEFFRKAGLLKPMPNTYIIHLLVQEWHEKTRSEEAYDRLAGKSAHSDLGHIIGMVYSGKTPDEIRDAIINGTLYDNPSYFEALNENQPDKKSGIQYKVTYAENGIYKNCYFSNLRDACAKYNECDKDTRSLSYGSKVLVGTVTASDHRKPELQAVVWQNDGSSTVRKEKDLNDAMDLMGKFNEMHAADLMRKEKDGSYSVLYSEGPVAVNKACIRPVDGTEGNKNLKAVAFSKDTVCVLRSDAISTSPTNPDVCLIDLSKLERTGYVYTANVTVQAGNMVHCTPKENVTCQYIRSLCRGRDATKVPAYMRPNMEKQMSGNEKKRQEYNQSKQQNHEKRRVKTKSAELA